MYICVYICTFLFRYVATKAEREREGRDGKALRQRGNPFFLFFITSFSIECKLVFFFFRVGDIERKMRACVLFTLSSSLY